MKLRISIAFSAIILLCLLGMGISSYAGIVTVDVATKTAVSDSAKLRVRARQVKVKADQVGLIVESTVDDPQTAVVRFNGIKDQSYDVYINGSYFGEKTSKALQTGLSIPIPGTVADPIMMRCLTALSSKVNAEYKRLQKIKGNEPQRVSYTLSQADDWVRSGIGSDQSYRSADIIINPSGIVLQDMTWRSRSDADETAATIVRACWLLQQARDRMYDVIKEPELRNFAVAILTPVDLTDNYSVKNGKPHVDVVLLNNCNLPISGNIDISVPNGWKTNANGLSFNNIKSGKTFKLSLDLIPTLKSAALPRIVPVAANVSVKQDSLYAKFKLQAPASITPKVVK